MSLDVYFQNCFRFGVFDRFQKMILPSLQAVIIKIEPVASRQMHNVPRRREPKQHKTLNSYASRNKFPLGEEKETRKNGVYIDFLTAQKLQ